MKTFASLATVAALVGVAAAQGSPPTVTTPTSLVECQPAQFTVSGGTAPYFISILPGGETGATPLENLPQQDAAGSVTWTVDIQSGTAITIAIRDSTGALNYSQQVTIQPGTSASCLGANSGSSASATGSASASGGGGGATSASSAASSAPASSSSRASSSAASSSSAAASSSKASSSAPASSSSEAASTSAAASSSAPSASASNSGAGELLAQTGFLGAVAAFVMAVVA